MGCILGVTNELLKTDTADSDETFRVNRAYPESVQRHIFDFRSKPGNRFFQFFQNLKYFLWEKYLNQGYANGGWYIPLTKAESALNKPWKFHSNRFMRLGDIQHKLSIRDT